MFVMQHPLGVEPQEREDDVLPLLTVPQVAEVAGISAQAVRLIIRRGELPATRSSLGRKAHYLVHVDDVVAWMHARQVGSPSS